MAIKNEAKIKNALIVAISLRNRDSVSAHFGQLESLWEKNRVYVGKDNA